MASKVFIDKCNSCCSTVNYSMISNGLAINRENTLHNQVFSFHCYHRQCDTGTSGQRRSDGNIELVRFLDSDEGDGARMVFAGVQLLFKNKTPYVSPSKIAHR